MTGPNNARTIPEPSAPEVPGDGGLSAAMGEVVQLCSELIRIDSVNTGDPDTIGDGEARAARYIQGKLEEVGYETTYL
jgi:acetylornithine deacetylase/succinyl-diaminopimelate desuccinylase-like protein